MSYGLKHDWDDIARDVDSELTRARSKFPKPDHVTLAMAEEAGETVKAALNHMYKPGAARAAVTYQEAIQTIAMCVRLIQEGDPSIGLPSQRSMG